jgi:Fe/S biogenesis protein NfuA
MSMSTTETSPFASPDPGLAGANDDTRDYVITVTDRAVEKLIELRDTEPEQERLGVRIEILSDEGTDFTYDLSFQIVTKAGITDVIRNHKGLKVIIPVDDVDNLSGATLDHEPDGLVLRNPNRPKPLRLDNLLTDDDVATHVKTVIDTEVNPALDAHGGFVTFVGHDGEGKAYLTMGGGCHGCSMSRMTMLQGVQTMITEQVPEIHKVLDVTDHTTGANPYYS